jgi:tripartite-type tricarboxylate transporter receptor subunit TctC
MVFEIPSVAAGRNQIPCEPSLPNAKKSRHKNLFPVGTSSAIINRPNADIGKIVESAEVRNIWETKGVNTVTGTRAELGQKLEEDCTWVGQVLMELRIKQ